MTSSAHGCWGLYPMGQNLMAAHQETFHCPRNKVADRVPSLSFVGGFRCHLSASPATGLVGMEESVFLSDYFCCFGFFPVTCRRYASSQHHMWRLGDRSQPDLRGQCTILRASGGSLLWVYSASHVHRPDHSTSGVRWTVVIQYWLEPTSQSAAPDLSTV